MQLVEGQVFDMITIKKNEKELPLTELSQTAGLMISCDYKERYKAEYYQVVLRYEKLKDMLKEWDNGTLRFQPVCPRSTYNLQIKAMADYIAILEARAVMERIVL